MPGRTAEFQSAPPRQEGDHQRHSHHRPGHDGLRGFAENTVGPRLHRFALHVPSLSLSLSLSLPIAFALFLFPFLTNEDEVTEALHSVGHTLDLSLPPLLPHTRARLEIDAFFARI